MKFQVCLNEASRARKISSREKGDGEEEGKEDKRGDASSAVLCQRKKKPQRENSADEKGTNQIKREKNSIKRK